MESCVFVLESACDLVEAKLNLSKKKKADINLVCFTMLKA